MGALPVKTYTNAIKEDWLSSFPGLFVATVQKYLLKLVQTVMEHLHIILKRIGPTSSTEIVKIKELMESIIEPDIEMEQQILLLDRKHKVGVAVFKFKKLNSMISMDLP